MIIIMIYIITVLVSWIVMLAIISMHQDVTRKIRREALAFSIIPIANIFIAGGLVVYALWCGGDAATDDDVVIKRRSKCLTKK